MEILVSTINENNEIVTILYYIAISLFPCIKGAFMIATTKKDVPCYIPDGKYWQETKERLFYI